MDGQWKEVVRLRFKGKRFRDHALDLSALTELSKFQKLVAETAKALWRAANPDRKKLPPHFEDRTRLCLRQIEDGSAVAPLEVYLDEPEQGELWEPGREVNQAIDLAHAVFESAERDKPLPVGFPKNLIPEYAKWGQTMEDDASVEFMPPGKEPAQISMQTRLRLASFAETPYEDVAQATGEVLEADVRKRRFQLWLDDETSVSVSFTEDQEEQVTTALKEHKAVRLSVTGRGEYAPDGKLQRMPRVDLLEIVSGTGYEYDPNAPAIEDVLSSIASKVPNEAWGQVPKDLSGNLDHYLYGGSEQ